MTFKNTSRYPTDEVRRLVEFALKNIDHRKVAVHVKNCKGHFSGRAYGSVPCQSPLSRRKVRRLKYLMTVHIGKPEFFPYEGRYGSHKGDERWPLIQHRDWRECLVGIAAHEAQHIKQFQCRMPISELECERVALKRITEYRQLMLPLEPTE